MPTSTFVAPKLITKDNPSPKGKSYSLHRSEITISMCQYSTVSYQGCHLLITLKNPNLNDEYKYAKRSLYKNLFYCKAIRA